MSYAVSVKAVARHCARDIGLSVFAIALYANTAFGFPQDASRERQSNQSVSATSPTSGEIEYSFDPALERTTARFKSSLASPRLLSRLLSGPPQVHTLQAFYEFAGRALLEPPATVGVSFFSDEDMEAESDMNLSLVPKYESVLIIRGETDRTYLIGVAQKSDLFFESVLPVINGSPGNTNSEVSSPRRARLHVERQATAWIPTCDFMAFVGRSEIRGTVAGLDFEVNPSVMAGLRRFVSTLPVPIISRTDPRPSSPC